MWTHFLLILICMIFMNLSTFAGGAEQTIAREEAIRLFEKGVSLNDNSQAEADFYQQAIAINPNYTKAYYNLAFIYHSWGEFEKAINLYQRCLDIDPTQVELHYNLAECLLRAKRETALYRVRHHLNISIEMQQTLPPRLHVADLSTQRAKLLAIETRINFLSQPVIAEEYSQEEMIEILDRPIKRGGQALYQGPRLPLLLFKINSAGLSQQGKALLLTLSRSLKDPRFSSKKFVIEGHTDGSGSIALNKALSQKRAEAVHAWLIKKGKVKKEKLSLVFFGEDHPIYPNNSLNNYRYNRRVEITRRLDI